MSTVAGTWMGLQLPSPTVITKCRIKTYNPTLPSYSPSELLLLGSTDGTTWVELRTILNPFNDTPNGPGIHKTYSFTNTTAYAYYRLVIVRGGGYLLPRISCFYLADSADTNYPPGYLSGPTANGYTLTQPFDLSVGGPFGISWHPVTTYIANNTLEDEVTYVGGTNYSGISPYLYGNIPRTETTYNGNSVGTWIQIQLPSSTVITKYRIVPDPNNAPSQNPTELNLLGSTDGSTWKKLSSIDNVNAPDVAGPGLHKTFNFTNTKAYSYYRLIIVRGGTSNYTTICGFYLSDSSDTNYPPGLLATATSDGYTLTQASDLYVVKNWSLQATGSSWAHLTQNIANVNIISDGQHVGGTGNYPASNNYYYTGSISTSYAILSALPSAPILLAAYPGDGTITVVFSAADEGTGTITTYQYSIDGGITFLPRPDAAPATFNIMIIPGFTNGQTYSVMLRAVSTNGYGPSSNTLYATPFSTQPSAPTSLSASAGNQSAVISFTPGSSGSSPITNYKYSIDNGATYTAFSPAVTTSPVVITGLTNGQSYSIKLLAVSVSGDGTPSSTITVTPHSVPDAPTNLVATYSAPGSVSISFTPGSNGGETITNYLYSIDCGATFTALSPVDGTSPIIINGLTIGQSYCIELRAVNSLGAGVASSSVQYTATGLPTAPTSITWVDLKNGMIAVSFTPGSDEGSAITNYEYSLNGGLSYTALNPANSSSPITISGLSERVNYVLVIRAINANGAGTASAPVSLRYMCFLEGTKILCYNPETEQEEYRAVETLRKGTLVKTTYSGYKAIDTIGTSKIYNPGNSMRSLNRLYKCSKENYPELTDDLVITGCHSILVKELTEEERALSMEFQGKIYATDRLYRLIAAVDQRSQPYESEGVFNIWHFALENTNYYFNYGVYANGLLVETSSLRMMREQSGMDLIQ